MIIKVRWILRRSVVDQGEVLIEMDEVESRQPYHFDWKMMMHLLFPWQLSKKRWTGAVTAPSGLNWEFTNDSCMITLLASQFMLANCSIFTEVNFSIE